MQKPISTAHLVLQEKLIAGLASNIAARGIKINWAAQKAGLDPQFVGAILRREKNASLNTLILLGEALELELKADWKRK